MSDEDPMKARAQYQLAVEVGDTMRGLYRHYKGGLYIVFSESVDVATGQLLVHYYSVERQTRWTRTLDTFQSVVVVEVDGRPISANRFTLIRAAAEAEVLHAATDNEGEVEDPDEDAKDG